MTMKIGVLISGSGTNLQAIVDSISAGKLDASVELVISSRPDAHGLRRASDAGIRTMALSREVYEQGAERADSIIANELRLAGCEYVVMAGYMRKVTMPLLLAYPDHVVNIHPALLPAFPGAHGIADAFDYGVRYTGVTVHFADAGYDDGPIIDQRVVLIEPDDTMESLEERIHEAEHELYPAALQLLAQGRVRIVTRPSGRRVTEIAR
jgi:phosphoribosylglycinamide formyltransferase-1